MSNKNIIIGVITPNKEFNKLAETIVHRLDSSLQIKTANAVSYQALAIAKQMELDGIEVIIGRHGTGLLMSKNLNIPVLCVPYGSLQLLKCMSKAAEWGDRVLLPLYDENIEGIPELQKIFNIEILCLNRFDFKSSKDLLIKGKELNCHVLLGGKSTTIEARELGYKAIEIPISKSALVNTIKNALSVAESRQRERERNQLNQKIIDSSLAGIITVDKNGYITSINSAAQSILNTKQDLISGQKITQVLPGTEIESLLQQGEEIRNKIETIDNDRFLLNCLPVIVKSNVVGGIINIQNISNVQTAEYEIRRTLTRRFVAKYTINDFIHHSRKSKNIIERVKRFAVYDSTVLIIGQTGTGKEVIAQSIHNCSRRSKGPFVSINCASIPKDLLESELFGYEEGAFTGSRRGGKPGLFELAHGGTIFLDEIDSSPLEFQPLLLRVLQEREVMRVGGNRLIPIDLRVIAASSKRLDQQVIEGLFREDLYFRLNILTLHISPLRDRIEDLPFLAKFLILKKSRKNSLSPIKIPKECLDRLAKLPWLGNVRELSNFIEKLVILSEGKFELYIFDELYSELINYSLKNKSDSFKIKDNHQNELENKTEQKDIIIIKDALIKCNFNRDATARKLGISRTTLWRKIKDLNIM